MAKIILDDDNIFDKFEVGGAYFDMTVLDIGSDIESLIGDMERSIAEADDFIKTMS